MRNRISEVNTKACADTTSPARSWSSSDIGRYKSVHKTTHSAEHVSSERIRFARSIRLGKELSIAEEEPIMRAHPCIIALLASTLASSAALADATVTATSGGFLVSQGHGFTRTTQTTRLKTGDKVTVTEGNGATLTYSDSCKVDVRPGYVFIIGPVSPCALGQGANDPRERCLQARTDEERLRLRCPPGTAGQDYGGYALAAGAVILGGAAAAIALSGNDNGGGTGPMSP